MSNEPLELVLAEAFEGACGPEKVKEFKPEKVKECKPDDKKFKKDQDILNFLKNQKHQRILKRQKLQKKNHQPRQHQ